jgi:hypothetical protein
MVVDRLSPAARELLAWIVDRDGMVTVDEMERRVGRPQQVRYGRFAWTPDTIWESSPGRQPDPLTELLRHALVFSIVAGPGGYYRPSGFVIPAEMLEAGARLNFFDLGPMVPPPLEEAEVSGGVVPAPGDLLRDIGHLLGFLGTGRCEYRQDGQPYKRSLVQFGKLIGKPDQAYVDLLWQLALFARLVQREPAAPPDYQTEYAVRAAGDYSPHELILQLLDAWVVPGRAMLTRGGAFYVEDNPRVRLLQLMTVMPVDTWLKRSSVRGWLAFACPMLFDPAQFGIPGSPLEPAWGSVSKLLLAAGTTADGVDAVMLPAGHQRLLDPDTSPDAVPLPPWEDRWTIQPDRTIVAPPNLHPDAIAELWQVAALESNKGALIFRVTPASVADSLNRGMTPDEIRATLLQRSRTPLPPTVERLVGDQSARYGRIKVGQAETFVQTDDPALLDELRRNAKLRSLSWHDVAPGVAFVQGNGPDSVIDLLRKANYLPVKVDRGGKPHTITSSASAAAANPPTAKQIRSAINGALRKDATLAVTWTERGRIRLEHLTPIDEHGTILHAARADGISEVEIPFAQIQYIKIDEADVVGDVAFVTTWDEEP